MQKTIESTIEFVDVADAWKGLVDRKSDLTERPHTSAAASQYAANWSDDAGFYGGSAAEMRGWIDHGYEAPGMTLRRGANTRPRARWKWDEEGELQVDVAIEGHDQPYLRRKPVKRTPGLKVQIGYNARSTVPATVLAAYGRWVASMLAGLQDRGLDLEISVFSTADLCKPNLGLGGTIVRSHVRVKRFGRKSSLKSWGALFSPTGYRMLGFTARMMACAEHKVTCPTHMGASLGPGWGVKFDAKTRTLTVNVNVTETSAFPAEHMTRQLSALKF
jgi:hypothetical protein